MGSGVGEPIKNRAPGQQVFLERERGVGGGKVAQKKGPDATMHRVKRDENFSLNGWWVNKRSERRKKKQNTKECPCERGPGKETTF